jgi:hypothetical protein
MEYSALFPVGDKLGQAPLLLDGPAGRHDNKDGIGTSNEEIQYIPCAHTFAQEGIVTIHENKEKK